MKIKYNFHQAQSILPIIIGISFLVVLSLFLVLSKKSPPPKTTSTPNELAIPESLIIQKSSSKDHAFENTTNTFQTFFKDYFFKESSITFQKDISKISFYTPQQQSFGILNSSTAKAENNTVLYSQVFQDTDLKYTLTEKRLLEEFIISTQPTALKFTQISQIAKTENIDHYEKSNDGSIHFFSQGQIKFTLPKPVLYEMSNQENKNYGIEYQIIDSSPNTYQINKIITPEGQQWLANLNRNYPIAIDLVIDNADTVGNWVTSDSINTPVAQETTITHGGTGSIKISTSGYAGTGADGACNVIADANINTGPCDGISLYGDAVKFSSTVNTAAGSTAITLSTTPDGLNIGDEVLIINLQGTTTVYTDVGEYDTRYITNISTNTLTLDHGLTNTYDGTTQKIMVQRIPQYTTVSVGSGINFSPSAWNGTTGGVIFFRANSTVTATGNIHANSLGFRGGAGGVNTNVRGGYTGETYTGYNVGYGGGSVNAAINGGGRYVGAATSSPNDGYIGGGGGGGGAADTGSGDECGGSGGGGGYSGGGGGGSGGGASYTWVIAGGSGGNTGISGGGGGGAHGAATDGAGGNAGSAGDSATGTGGQVGSGATSASGAGGANSTGNYGAGGGGGGGIYSSSTKLYLGSGGGGGGAGNVAADVGTSGGYGGGIVVVSANTINITGTIRSNGENGTNAAANSSKGLGGGGSGGTVILQGSTLSIGTTRSTAIGGLGGMFNSVRQGGAGGVGAVYARYTSSISGTANPTYSADTSPLSTNDTITKTTAAMDLSTVNTLTFWVRSNVTGNRLRFQFGEAASTEQTYNITVNTADTWEQKTWDISGIAAASKNAVTLFAFQVTDSSQSISFYFDDISFDNELIVPESCVLEKLVSNNGINISWIDTNTIETGYEIRRSVDGGAFILLTTVGVGITGYSDNTTSSGHTYQYQVYPFFTGPIYGDYCQTSLLNLQVGNFRMDGLKLEGIQLN